MSTSHLLRPENTIPVERVIRETWCGLDINDQLFKNGDRVFDRTRIGETDCTPCLRESFQWANNNEQPKVLDHPTKHMVDIPIHVEVGETIEVNGQHFILTDFIQELNRPSTVIFKQPSEMVEENGDLDQAKRFFGEAMDAYRDYEPKPEDEELEPFQVPESLKSFFDGIREAVAEIMEKQRGPVGPLKVVDKSFEEGEDGDG